jgi:hypothetical protein
MRKKMIRDTIDRILLINGSNTHRTFNIKFNYNYLKII